MGANLENLPKEIVKVLAHLTNVNDVAFYKLKGGRTNSVWKATTDEKSYVCKVFGAPVDNLIFPNSPNDEIKTLEYLYPYRVAPKLKAFEVNGDLGVVIYDYLDGEIWKSNAKPVGDVLREIHGIIPPKHLRTVKSGSDAILAQSDQLACGMAPKVIEKLTALRPSYYVEPSQRTCFLHGDPVPGNIVIFENRAQFIDWQCPAVGDPTEDLATFLSPAMQMLYRGEIASDKEIEDLKFAYDNPDVFNRLDALRPYYHYRMAMYCLWKFENGHADYLAAAELEIAALQQLT